MVRVKITKAVHPFEEGKEYDVSPVVAYRLQQAGNKLVNTKEVKEKKNKSMQKRKKKTKAL